MSETSPNLPVSLIDCATAYVERFGLSLCLLRPNSKLPLLDEWNAPSRTMMTREAVTTMLSRHPRSGIGLVHDLARTFAFDIDHVDSVRALFAEFGWDYDALLATFPRIQSREGKDKFIARLPDGFYPGSGDIKSKTKLNWPDPTGECDAQGRPKLITVFELRGGENQDVLPPSIHPDTQAPYQWASGQAPWDFGGIPEIAADHPLLILWAQWDTFKPQLEAACPWLPTQSRPTPPQPRIYAAGPNQNVIGQFNRAFSVVEILERNGYKKRGKRWLAPHSSTKIPGVCLLEGGKVYSHHGSDILNNGHAHDAFSVFTVLEHGDSIEQAVKSAALILGVPPSAPETSQIDYDAFVRNTKARQAAASVRPAPKAPPAPLELSPILLDQAPGLIGDILRYGLDTAHKPLPHLTLQAALAVVSVVASRKYRTTRNNWPTLWFLNIEKTASGKEHPETLVEIILEAAGLGDLVAGAGYTSAGAVFSMALDRPAHIAVIDEFGKVMQSSQAKGNQQKADAITILMQAFGRCHGILRPPAYSSMGLSKEMKKELQDRKIHNPGIVILAGTTPGTFYESISSQWIADGFLGRFIVSHSNIGRQVSRDIIVQDVPDSISNRIREISRHVAPIDELMTRDELIQDADKPAAPIALSFSSEASRLFRAFEHDTKARADAAESWGLDSLFGRTVEKALRLSMLVCLAEDTQGRQISGSQAQYAIDYVSEMDASLVEQAKIHVSDSPFARVRNLCLEHIRQAGGRGLTLREVGRKCRQFDALRPREQQDVLAALQATGEIALTETAGPSGRGRKRTAWVWTEETEEDSGDDA